MLPDYSALADDVFVNLRLNVKMDLPTGRETVLGLFDRLRRQFPAMHRLRRTPSEFVLESSPAAAETDEPTGRHADPGAGHRDGAGGAGGAGGAAGGAGGAGRGKARRSAVPEADHQWASIRKRAIRCGVLNPVSSGRGADAYALHRSVLELAPYFLTLSPLDVDFVELMYGLDLLSGGNHDAIVYDALIAGSPLGRLLEPAVGTPMDVQPLLGLSFAGTPDLQAYVEVKTRSARRGQAPVPGPHEGGELLPLSIYLTVRHYGPVEEIGELAGVFERAASRAEDLLADRVVPNLVTPLREAIAAAGDDSTGDQGPGGR